MKPSISVIKRYAKSDAVTWEDVNLNERDVLIPLVRIALAAKAREQHLDELSGDVLPEPREFARVSAQLDQKVRDSLDAIDWDD